MREVCACNWRSVTVLVQQDKGGSYYIVDGGGLVLSYLIEMENDNQAMQLACAFIDGMLWQKTKKPVMKKMLGE